jgi:hypothetical protein
MNDILTELLPRKVRLWLYVLVGLGSGVLAAYQAANGDWLVFAGAVAALLTSLLAARNINPPPAEPIPEPEPLVSQVYPEPSAQPPSGDGRRGDYGTNL